MTVERDLSLQTRVLRNLCIKWDDTWDGGRK